jgi:hypothetical protein
MQDALPAAVSHSSKTISGALTLAPAIAPVPLLQAAALRQQEAAVRKEQADVLKAAERAEKEVRPCPPACQPVCLRVLPAGRPMPVAMHSAD